MRKRICLFSLVFLAMILPRLHTISAVAEMRRPTVDRPAERDGSSGVGQTHAAADEPSASSAAEDRNGKDPAQARDKDRVIHQLRERVSDLQRQVKKLQEEKARQPAGGQRRIVPLLETMYYGPVSYAANGPRYFAARLLLVNLTGKTVALQQEGIRLQVGKRTLLLKPVDSRYRYSEIYIGTRRYRLGDLKPARVLTIRPGRTAATWILFSNVGTDNAVPAMQLLLTFDRQKISVDVNERAREQLALTVERIGPRGSLGLLTIAGQLNTVNVQDVVDAADKLSRAQPKVLRFVIRWTKSAGRLNSRLQSWLMEQAQRAGQPVPNAFSNYPYPTFPGAVRTLHLARIPGYTVNNSGRSASPATIRRIHNSDLEAVAFALTGAYRGLPVKELVREIRDGHPLTRAAALINGADRLPAEELPLLLQYVDDTSQPRLQRAAITALRHFGEPAAIGKLAEVARRSSAVLSRAALESLAASRFAAAHRKLLAILQQETTEGKKRIISILAAHPRPLWSQPIYEYLRDAKAGVGVEALRALVVVGHPKLMDILETALKGRDESLRKEAFRQLVSRSDARSERIALQYALNVLKTAPPDSQILALLNRTKDRRAIPLLLKHLDGSAGNKSQLIQLLGRIGDHSTAEALAQRYDRMKSDYEKAAVLRALVQLKSPRFPELAAKALRSRNSTLLNAACDGLRSAASPQAVQLLIDALEKSTDSNAWVYTSSSLSQIGTSKARAALLRVRDNPKTPVNKKRYVINALKSLWQRSPAYQYLYRARHSLRQRQYAQTLEFCNLALKIDPQLPWAYSCRGHVFLRQKKWAEAQRDFQQAERDDPYDPYAVTGSALMLVHNGPWRKAVEKIERRKNDFSGDRIFPYHAARVCSRAAVLARKSQSDEERQRADRLEQKAVEFLKTAVKLGRSSSNGYKIAQIRSEPDFAPLHQRDDYKQLVGDGKPASSPAGRKKPTGKKK